MKKKKRMVLPAYLHKAGHTGGILRLEPITSFFGFQFLEEKRGQTNMLAMSNSASSSLINSGFVTEFPDEKDKQNTKSTYSNGLNCLHLFRL